MMSGLSDKATLLHSKMVEASPSTLFGQEELQTLLHIMNPVDLLTVAQELIDRNLIKLVKQGDELKFQAVTQDDAKRINQMSDEEAMIYSYIEASGREGIWTKTIKVKTNLHQHIVVRCLKSLEGQRYIKSIKSVKNPTRKIYMLYNLQPSIEVTGGPWFTDSELDTEFIDSLMSVIWRFVASKSYPSSFQQVSTNTNVVQASYPFNYAGFVGIESIMEFITSNKITNIELAMNDIRSLCDVLVYDDKLELTQSSADTYKATWQSVVEAGYGRAYEEENQTLIPASLKSLVAKNKSSIFDYHSAMNIDDNAEDTVYLDSWILD